MSKHTISHADRFLAGNPVVFNLDSDFYPNSLRGIPIQLLAVEAFPAGTEDFNSISGPETLAAGGQQDFVLDGVDVVDGVAIFGYCSIVSITAAANETARTFTILGKDANGRPQAEEVTGPNATTSRSLKHFTTIDRIFSDADTAGAVQFGLEELSSRGLRTKAALSGLPAAAKSQFFVLVEDQTLQTAGTFVSGNEIAQTAINVDQRASLSPVAGDEKFEVMYIADLTKEGTGENFTDSSQRVPSAI